jgi:uncharacterized lipoprotein NlpE involved in copper resistance
MYEFKKRGIPTAKRASFFSADDGGVSAIEADGSYQAITQFSKEPVLLTYPTVENRSV